MRNDFVAAGASSNRKRFPLVIRSEAHTYRAAKDSFGQGATQQLCITDQCQVCRLGRRDCTMKL